MGVVELDHQAKGGAIWTGEAQGVDLHDRAHAGKDRADPGIVPVLLREVPGHDVSQPLGGPDEAVLRFLHPLEANLHTFVREGLETHGGLASRTGEEAEEENAMGGGGHLKA